MVNVAVKFPLELVVIVPGEVVCGFPSKVIVITELLANPVPVTVMVVEPLLV